MVLRRKRAKDLEHFGRAAGRFGRAVEALSRVDPPEERAPTEHPEIVRLASELDRATAIVEAAVAATFMTAAQYGRVAQHFERIAEAMEKGAGVELAAEKRGSAGRRRVAAPAVRKPRRRISPRR